MCSTCTALTVKASTGKGVSLLPATSNPVCRGAQFRNKVQWFKLKALTSFSVSNFETGCFQARVSLHRPTGRLDRRTARAVHSTEQRALRRVEKTQHFVLNLWDGLVVGAVQVGI